MDLNIYQTEIKRKLHICIGKYLIKILQSYTLKVHKTLILIFYIYQFILHFFKLKNKTRCFNLLIFLLESEPNYHTRKFPPLH